MGRKILLIYANEYFLISPVYPFGLDIIAQYLEKKGHHVGIDLPFLTGPDLSTGIEAALDNFMPDIIGVGIRNIDTAMAQDPTGAFKKGGISTHFFLPGIARMIRIIKQLRPDIPVVAGGAGLSVSPEAVLACTGADFGITGPGARPMAMFAERYPECGGIPNLICPGQPVPELQEKYTDLDLITGRKNPAFNHSFETIGMPVLTGHGCCMNCAYCVEPSMTGRRVTLRTPEAVIDELWYISENHPDISEIFFVNTEFNVPTPEQSLAILKAIVSNRLNERFRFSSQFLPVRFTEEYAGSLAMAGCYVILTCDSFFDPILTINNSPYRKKDIVQTLDLLEQFTVPCTMNLIFGLPGESVESIHHTLDMINTYTASGLVKFEYTAGARIYDNTGLARYIEHNPDEKHLYGIRSKGHIEPWFYSSPRSPEALNALIKSRLSYEQAFIPTPMEDNRALRTTAYWVDRQECEKACGSFFDAPLRVKVSLYDYLFRKLTQTGRDAPARQITMDFITSLENDDPQGAYADRLPVARFFLSLL